MKKLVAIGLLLLPLSGCLSEKRESGWSDSDVAAFFSGGGTAAVRPAPAPAQPNLSGTAGVMAAQEQHGAVNQSNCYDMEARFKRAGRRVRLVEIRKNTIGVGGVLDWVCVFEDDNSGDADSGYYEPHY